MCQEKGQTGGKKEEVGATDMTDQFRTSPSCLIDWHGVWENEHLFIQMTAIRQERHKDVPCLDKRKRRLFCFLVDTGRECVGPHRETINDFLNQP